MRDGEEVHPSQLPIRGRGEVDQDLAELAHVGAMVKWLVGEVVPYPVGSKRVIVTSCGHHWHIEIEWKHIEHSGTLTEALAHACGQIAKEKDNA